MNPLIKEVELDELFEIQSIRRHNDPLKASINIDHDSLFEQIGLLTENDTKLQTQNLLSQINNMSHNQ